MAWLHYQINEHLIIQGVKKHISRNLLIDIDLILLKLTIPFLSSPLTPPPPPPPKTKNICGYIIVAYH